jgi:hypothetical protein
MKKRINLLTLLLLTISVHSQIKVRNDVKLNEINNSSVRLYDSISDFNLQENNIDYLKYIGQKLFLPPLSSKNKKGADIGILSVLELNVYEAKEQIPDTVYVQQNLRGTYDGYYDKKAEKIASELRKHKVKTKLYKPYISIIVGNPYNFTNLQLSREAFNKDYKIINITNTNNENLRSVTGKLNKLRIWLTTTEKDTIYFDKDLAFSDKTLSPFLIKGFYQYHEKNYTAKSLFIFKESENDYYGKPKKKYIDINSGEAIILKVGDLWECKEIVFVKTKFGQVYYPYYILKKGDKEIKIQLGNLFKSGLLTLEELDIMYNYWLQEKQNIKDSEELNKSILMNDCSKIFDKSNCEKLINNEVEIGMTKEMILYTFGEPFKTFRIKTESGIEEILSYGSTILYFKNKRIFAIKQR